ncbi:MAG TPA: ankyrin repeat domain-containing protein [Verrucomicrobiae bacterium]
MAERLLTLGAEIGAVTKWWAGGIGVRTVDPTVAEFLIQRGAVLTVHAASALGLIPELEKLLDSDPSLIQAKGTDACSPLHFARNIPTAKFLVDRGAQLDARDEDHDSTPAQWLIGDAPEVSRYLVERGAMADIYMAAAWGDRILAEKLISADRSCLSQWIGRGPDFPSLGYKQSGGTIYQWTLGFNSFPHQIALKKGHTELFNFLFVESDAKTQFLVCCVLARRNEAQSILAQNPGLVGSLDKIDLELLARYCWETNLHIEAVRLMLDLGFPISSPESAHGYTPLHNAAWAGDADLVELLLQRGHPTNIIDPRYKATPLNYALHDCLVEKRHPEGDFVRVVKLLLDAGSPLQGIDFPTGNDAIDELLRPGLSAKTSPANRQN